MAAIMEKTTHGDLVAECRAALVRTLDEFVCSLGYVEPDCRETVRHAAGQRYDELAGLRGRRGFEQAHGLTASHISLVHEDDLDFSLHLSELARKLREHCEVTLGRLHLRFMTLLEQDDAAAEQLPVGPELVCDCLRALADSAGLDGEARARLVEQCQPTLADHLKAFYGMLDERLAHAGVQMKPLARPTQTARVGQPATPAAPTASREPEPTAPTEPLTPLANLQQALMRRRALPGEEPETVDPQLAASIMAQIRAWLSAQQQSGARAPRIATSALGQLLAPSTAATVEALECIFERIADNPALPEPVRTAIASLQIPLVKLALGDEKLLGDKDHPALPLIDALAEAGNTLPIAGTPHPGFDRLGAIARTVTQIPEPHKQDLRTALRQVQTFTEERTKVAMHLAETAQAIAAKAERREAARLFASRALGVLIDDDTAAAIRYFLRKHWIQVLARTLYKHGEKHPDWRAQLEVANQLVLSGRPGPDGRMPPEQIDVLPALIQRVENGLASLGLGQQAREAALADCMEHHSALIAGRPPEIAYASTAAPERMSLSRSSDIPELMMLHHTGYAAPRTYTSNLHTLLTVGTWVELALPDDSTLLGCVAWLGQGRKIALLADPDSGRLLAATMKCLTDLQRDTKLTVRNVGSVTDEAAQTAARSIAA